VLSKISDLGLLERAVFKPGSPFYFEQPAIGLQQCRIKLYLSLQTGRMKKFLFSIALMIAIMPVTRGQDVISLHNGNQIKARIVHVFEDEVQFIPDGSTDTTLMKRADIEKLSYRNGIQVHFSEGTFLDRDTTLASSQMYQKGYADAARYYKGYKMALTGTLITSFFVPMGLIPALACSSTPPAEENLGYRNPELISDPAYDAGYKDKAFEIKKKKVWRGFMIGTGATAAYFLIIAMAFAL
jgi:hypothetical protein